ncbi:hypothetical protein JB92DRAFT_2835973 [Gautieria morchelliformis]|nr:hypothetical protein JB92DRAFT_2835973 [Gautieria morchelliformis]
MPQQAKSTARVATNGCHKTKHQNINAKEHPTAYHSTVDGSNSNSPSQSVPVSHHPHELPHHPADITPPQLHENNIHDLQEAVGLGNVEEPKGDWIEDLDTVGDQEHARASCLAEMSLRKWCHIQQCTQWCSSISMQSCTLWTESIKDYVRMVFEDSEEVAV